MNTTQSIIMTALGNNHKMHYGSSPVPCGYVAAKKVTNLHFINKSITTLHTRKEDFATNWADNFSIVTQMQEAFLTCAMKF